MRKCFFIFILFFIISTQGLTKNICHEKPPLDCEKCCSITNESKFIKFVTSACKDINRQSKDSIADAILKHASSYAMESKEIIFGSKTIDQHFYSEYLKELCFIPLTTRNTIAMSFSECAKGCPKDKKGKSKN